MLLLAVTTVSACLCIEYSCQGVQPAVTGHIFASAVGSVVGMTIAIRGGDAVVWYRHAPEAFPYIKVS